MTDRPFPRSKALAARVLHAALVAVREAGGQLHLGDIRALLQRELEFDEWASYIIESNGLPRWEMYLHFFSIDAVKANYLIKSRGVWSLTGDGVAALNLGAEGFLRSAQQKYRAWQKMQTPKVADAPVLADVLGDDEQEVPPEEGMDAILQDAHQRLAAEILERLKASPPSFFERVVLETLLKMGYGGSRAEAGKTLGRSGDGGVDGVINEDKLGLDAVYLQAKRWSNDVGAAEIRDFKGALDGNGATKGVLITTAGFTRSALDEVSRSRNYRVVLIDGVRLARYMIEYNVGVSTAATYELKKIDSDYFAEE